MDSPLSIKVKFNLMGYEFNNNLRIYYSKKNFFFSLI